jgi:succinate dehydrogenase / fumarate reductase iron-sulfur subunit
MPEATVFRILRFRPEAIDPPQYREYRLTYNPHMTVLDGLERIRREQEPDLLYRHCCHHASCGTCACQINGLARLACVTSIADLEAPVVIEPLPHFEVLGDLVVDMQPLHRHVAAEWSGLRPCEQPRQEPPRPVPEGLDERIRLEDCIDCGCCLAACPVAHQDAPFMGPAALAAVNRQLAKHPEQSAELMDLVTGPAGESHCVRAVECSRRCPTGVSPARHIAELRRLAAQGGNG